MSLVVDGGGLVNKGGALGTGAACCCNKCSGPCDGETPCPEGCACVDGECVGGGACCSCDTSDYWAYSPVGNLQVFCDQAEAEEAALALLDEWLGRATAAADALSSAGWSCLTPDANVFSDTAPNWDGAFLENPDCDPEATVYRISTDFWSVGATCCGTVDTEAEPIELGDGLQAYPCIGPYTNFTCTDGVQPENCCAENHHPGKTCAQNPCVVIESCVAINGCTSDSDCVFQGQDDLAPAGCYCLGYFPAANGEPEQLGTCNANEFP
jgi:hypothetical protein